MATARVFRAEVADGPPGGRVRVYRGDMTGTAPVYGSVRVQRAAMSGVAAVILSPLSPVTAGPGELVSLTANLSGGGVADSYTWRLVSGPAVAFQGTGASRSFLAPSAMPPGASVVVGVTATIGAVTSTEQFVTVTVLPQTRWSRVHGGQWVGAVVAPA